MVLVAETNAASQDDPNLLKALVRVRRANSVSAHLTGLAKLQMTKIGRNQPCPCGSGLKYKRCHGSVDDTAAASPPLASADVQAVMERHRADQRIREVQQGLGRPIVGFKSGEHQIVAVGNTIYYSKKWKTFPDFLADYLKQKLTSDWGNAEIGKRFEDRHPLMQWYDAYCRYQQEIIKKPGELHSARVTGIVACYLGLAYSLYLLDHNAELQARLLRRLKDPSNFQGAFYELIVANALIRAGFTLTLEDETNGASKHCEFAAVSRQTGKKYWVEAKMRSIAGLLGKTDKDGGSDRNPISQLIPHLNGALQKPAQDERIIFIDLNAEPELDARGKPTWHDSAIERLQRYETKELQAGVTAYVFITNMACHRRLTEELMMCAVPFGLGLTDFNRPGYYRLSDAYRQKQKHIDAYHLADALMKYAHFPATFDGTLPSEAFGANQSRIRIGESYHFEGDGDGGFIGTVSTAVVNEPEKSVYFTVTDTNGNSQIRREPMTDAQLADYRAHPDAYFGRIMPVSKKIENRMQFFEWQMEVNEGLSRDTLLERLSKAPNFDAIKASTHLDLLSEYCEGMVAAFEAAGFKADQGKPE